MLTESAISRYDVPVCWQLHVEELWQLNQDFVSSTIQIQMLN